jgi:two-component system, LuxR family, response regulator FixJ
MTQQVYLVDDEEVIRRSGALLLKVAGFHPTSFDSGESFLAIEATLDSGCVLLDIRMPGIDGIAVQRELQLRKSSHVTVMMTGHGESASVIASFTAGAVAFIEKPFSKGQLLSALDPAFKKLNEPDLYRALIEAARQQLALLTKREQSVLEMLANDCSTDEMVSRLQISASELEMSRSSILQQLHVDTVPAALSVAFAARQPI